MGPYEKELRAVVNDKLEAIEHGKHLLTELFQDESYSLEASPGVEEFREEFQKYVAFISDELSKLEVVYDVLETVDWYLAEEAERRTAKKKQERLK